MEKKELSYNTNGTLLEIRKLLLIGKLQSPITSGASKFQIKEVTKNNVKVGDKLHLRKSLTEYEIKTITTVLQQPNYNIFVEVDSPYTYDYVVNTEVNECIVKEHYISEDSDRTEAEVEWFSPSDI